MRNRSVAALSLLMLATSGLVSLAACDKTKEAPAEENAAAEPVKAEELATMGHYADAFNAMIDKPQACFDEYFKHVPAEGPVTGQRYRLFARHSMAEAGLSTAKTRLAAASNQAPESLGHLEPLAKAALADLERVVKLFAEVHKYYDSESDADDQGAKGRELHKQMVTLADSYRENIDRFEAALSEVEQRHNQAELEKYEKDKGYSYWFRAFNFQANQLLKASDKQRYAQIFENLETVHRGLKSFVESREGEVHATFKAYLNQADRLHSTALKTSRAMREPKPNDAAISKLRGQLVDDYNSVVSVTNALYELESNSLLK